MTATHNTTHPRGTQVTDMAALNCESIVLRRARAQLRRDLRAGHVTVCELLDDLPDCLSGVLLVDLLRWQRFMGGQRLRWLNVWAIRDGVNLCLPAGAAGQRTRSWLRLHATAAAAGARPRLMEHTTTEGAA